MASPSTIYRRVTPAGVVAVVLVLLAGLANAATVAVVGRLGLRIGVIPALVFTSTVAALVAAITVACVPRGFSRLARGVRSPAWMWLPGLFGILYGFSIISAGPVIGVTATIALVISGQIVVGAIIDRFGIFGLKRISLSPSRSVAIVLLIGGSVLTLHR